MLLKNIKLIMILIVTSLFLAACGGSIEKDMNNVADDILENTTQVENILNKYFVVWEESVSSSGAIPISEMVEITGFNEVLVGEIFGINDFGNISSDFSDNIVALHSYYNGTGELEEIEEKSKKIKNKVTELNKPPKDYKDAYDVILDMYNSSTELTEMALNPQGFLEEFREKKPRLSNDISNKYKRLEVLIPKED